MSLAVELKTTIEDLAREATDDDELAELLIPHVLVAFSRVMPMRRVYAVLDEQREGALRITAEGDAARIAGERTDESAVRLAPKAVPYIPPCFRFLTCGRGATTQVFDARTGEWKNACPDHSRNATPFELRAIR